MGVPDRRREHWIGNDRVRPATQGGDLRGTEQVRQLVAGSRPSARSSASRRTSATSAPGIDRSMYSQITVQLGVLVEADPVVDRPDASVLTEEAVPSLRSALLTTRSKTAIAMKASGTGPGA